MPSPRIYVYEDPKTGELFHYSRKGSYRKNGRQLTFKGRAHILNLAAQKAQDYTISDETGACWEGYERVPNTKKGQPGSCRKKRN